MCVLDEKYSLKKGKVWGKCTGSDQVVLDSKGKEGKWVLGYCWVSWQRSL